MREQTLQTSVHRFAAHIETDLLKRPQTRSPVRRNDRLRDLLRWTLAVQVLEVAIQNYRRLGFPIHALHPINREPSDFSLPRNAQDVYPKRDWSSEDAHGLVCESLKSVELTDPHSLSFRIAETTALPVSERGTNWYFKYLTRATRVNMQRSTERLRIHVQIAAPSMAVDRDVPSVQPRPLRLG